MNLRQQSYRRLSAYVFLSVAILGGWSIAYPLLSASAQNNSPDGLPSVLPEGDSAARSSNDNQTNASGGLERGDLPASDLSSSSPPPAPGV